MVTANPAIVVDEVPLLRKPAITLPRLNSVDLLRGVVMIIMALDHVREFMTNLRFQPEDLSHTYPSLFFTRFITHFCAPTFFFLAGTGGFLAVARGKTVSEISRFYWTRGLWLIVLEWAVMSNAWTFDRPQPLAVVIWALGCCMVVMALLVHLPLRWIAAFGIVMIAGHNLLDGVQAASLGPLGGLWSILHAPGLVPIFGFNLWIRYPLIPWMGVMACGYAMGAVLMRPDRQKLTLRIGVALLLAFFVIRGINGYGNGSAGFPFAIGPWHTQSSAVLTVISFLNVQKYPASLDYLLLTLGPALILLSLLEKVSADQGIGKVVVVFGRVPMFYYLLHIYLIHFLAILVALAFHQPTYALWDGGVRAPIPPGYGHGLPFIYLMWVVTVVVLYFPCRWYMGFKARHRDWGWLSYL
jgi:uncharacterized membrane protein